MDFFKRNYSKPKPQEQPPQSLHHHLHHAVNNLQTHLSGIIHRLNPVSCNNNNKPFCSLSPSNNLQDRNGLALSSAEIKKRMAGIRIYNASNFSHHVSCFNVDKRRRMQLQYLDKADAVDLFNKVEMQGFGFGFGDFGRDCWKILEFPLTNVVEFHEGRSPIRLVPEMSQVKNAIEITNKKINGGSFSGVPVFQSNGFLITDPISGKKYRPTYLRKEDLEWARSKKLTPEKIKRDIIKVVALEDIIQEMKDSTTSKSNDVLFVGPDMSLTWFTRR